MLNYCKLMILVDAMRKAILFFLVSLPLVAIGQSVVTDLVRLPVFCDVAGTYKGTYSDGKTWQATIDPYTGLVSASISRKNTISYSTGRVFESSGTKVFSLDLPDGSAW